MAGGKLDKAKENKRDEFYTQRVDIENELKHYKKHFNNKIVYCNCDDPEYSNFYFFFKEQFHNYNLKKLITTHYSLNKKKSYKIEIFIKNGKLFEQKTELDENGDFRNNECIKLLKTVDIVVTNPPFSLFREYIQQLIENDKKFLIIGHQNAISYKEVFKLIKENKVWLGYGFKGGAGHFINKHYEDYATATNHKEGMIRVSGVHWFTNLEHDKRNQELVLYETYNKDKYLTYDNYDAINVDKTNEIPNGYYGKMGVPITFLDKYNPEQFEIIALGITGSIEFSKNKKMEILKNGKPTGKFTINAKGTLYLPYDKTGKKPPAFLGDDGKYYQSVYARVIIKRRKK